MCCCAHFGRGRKIDEEARHGTCATETACRLFAAGPPVLPVRIQPSSRRIAAPRWESWCAPGDPRLVRPRGLCFCCCRRRWTGRARRERRTADAAANDDDRRRPLGRRFAPQARPCPTYNRRPRHTSPGVRAPRTAIMIGARPRRYFLPWGAKPPCPHLPPRQRARDGARRRRPGATNAPSASSPAGAAGQRALPARQEDRKARARAQCYSLSVITPHSHH